MIDETTRRKMQLEGIVKLLRGGHELSPTHRDFLADGLERYIDGDRKPWKIKPGRGDSKDNINTFRYWACFYAARIDPELKQWPKSREHGYADIAECLCDDEAANTRNEKTVFNRAKRFHEDGAVWMLPRKTAEKFARKLGRPFSDDVYAEMVELQSAYVGREVFRN